MLVNQIFILLFVWHIYTILLGFLAGSLASKVVPARKIRRQAVRKMKENWNRDCHGFKCACHAWKICKSAAS